jgi:hypothetical protein
MTRDGALLLVLVTAGVLAVSLREGSGQEPPEVTLAAQPGPRDERVAFVVRGVGCAPAGDEDARIRIRKRISTPTLEYRGAQIHVRFRIHPPGRADPCPGDDPGTIYTLSLVAPLGERVLYDANADPPVPFRVETPR